MHTLIPYYRRKMKIKQNDMAKALDVSPSYLCKVEKGLLQPSKLFIESCTNFFKIPEEILFPKYLKKETMETLKNSFQNKLWSIRLEKGIKQNSLANQLGCSPSYLSKVEKGLKEPNSTFKKKCAKILRIKETELFPSPGR